jgi:hypothetical protein
VVDEVLTDRQREILEFIVTSSASGATPRRCVRSVRRWASLACDRPHPLATLQKRGSSGATPPKPAIEVATTRRPA